MVKCVRINISQFIAQRFQIVQDMDEFLTNKMASLKQRLENRSAVNLRAKKPHAKIEMLELELLR